MATATTTNQEPTPEAEINNLMTSAEYVESLKDGRQVYLYGEQVKDVTTHPAFRNATRSIARLYAAICMILYRPLRPGFPIDDVCISGDESCVSVGVGFSGPVWWQPDVEPGPADGDPGPRWDRRLAGPAHRSGPGRHGRVRVRQAAAG